LILFCFALHAQAVPPTALEQQNPVPYIPFQDLRALFFPNKHVRDWDYPEIKSIPHQKEVIARCLRDIELSTKDNLSPFQLLGRLYKTFAD